MWYVKSRRAQHNEDHETWIEGGVCPTLNAFDNTAEVRATVLIFEATRVDDTRMYDKYSPTVATYWGTGGSRVPYVINDQIPVRRLTPVECERLQGFPDNWTQYGNSDGEVKKVSATQRYKCLGNAVTVDVVEAVGRAIMESENQ